MRAARSLGAVAALALGCGGAGGTGGGPGTGGASTGGMTGGGGQNDAGGDAPGAPPGWVLTWSDEFDGPDGSAADPTNWGYDVGTGQNGWGNNELESYTSGTANAVVQSGNLVITAKQQTTGSSQYTSARLLSQGKFSQQYGRIEARIEIPEGQGIWPAFWMLGANINAVSWPTCGEIDIMENVGKTPSVNHGSLHMPDTGTMNDDQLTGSYTLPGGAKLGDAFHTYAIEWSASAIELYVDDNLYETQTPSTATGRAWAFDQPFFIILNVAVGGNFPGPPDSTTVFPQSMKVDWVRAYQRSDGG